ncbi:Uma2 family endonuclease [Pendulispora albinea]|uniref:Uma2 family endonuclease n=1 Tax=Pendulispora albinea TaxID=2741071 RepID=A0ABZ2LRG8_9BACT
MAAASVLHEHLYRIRRVDYEKMAESGVFGDSHVELLYGLIVQMSPKGPLHDGTIDILAKLFIRQLGDRTTVRIQNAFAASDGSEPEPDITIVPPGDYRKAHPEKALLVIEVADSSLETDREAKARLYAECGVPEYWVVNVRDGIVEVHTEIVRGAYTRVQPHRHGDHIRLVAFPDVEIAVSDVF